MNKYLEFKKLELEPTAPLTIIYRDELGNPKMWNCTIRSYEPLEPNGVILEVWPKRRGTLKRKISVPYYQELLIYKDHIDIDLNDIMYEKIEKSDGTYRTLKYDNYTSHLFTDIIKAYPNPLVYMPKE